MDSPTPSAEETQSQQTENGSITAASLDQLINTVKKHLDQDELRPAFLLLSRMLKSQQEEAVLPLLAQLCKDGHSHQMIKSDELMRPLMKYFNKLCNALEETSTYSHTEHEMMKVLCIVSQLINDCPKYRFPFNKKFVANLFLLDAELLGKSLRRKEIMRVVSVLFFALSNRIKLLKDFGMIRRLKFIILETYSLVEEMQTMRRFNSAIKNIGAQLPITIAQAVKYKLVATMSRFIHSACPAAALASWMVGMAPKQQSVKIEQQQKLIQQ